MNKLIHKYMGKEVNPKHYEKIKITGENTEPPKLTRKEFEAGKQGIVYMDTETGKLVFDEEEK